MKNAIRNTRFDALDYQIIHELRRIARTDAAKIAREIGANERTVRKRLNRLVDLGVVRLAAIVNPRIFDYDLAAHIFLKITLEDEDEVIPHLLAIPEVAYVAYGQGEQDVHLQVYFKNHSDLRKFMRQILPSIPGVQVNGHHLVLDVLRHSDEWMPGPEDFGLSDVQV